MIPQWLNQASFSICAESAASFHFAVQGMLPGLLKDIFFTDAQFCKAVRGNKCNSKYWHEGTTSTIKAH